VFPHKIFFLTFSIYTKGRFTPNATREIVAWELVCSMIKGDPRIRVAFASQVSHHCCLRSDAFALLRMCFAWVAWAFAVWYQHKSQNTGKV